MSFKDFLDGQCYNGSKLRNVTLTCYSSVVRAFAHGAMGRRINHSWGRPIVLFLIPASAPQLV